MAWPRHQITRKDGASYYYFYPPPPSLSSPLPPPPSPPPPPGSKISPAVLIVIVILAVLFFISGLLHLLVRFLTKHPNPSSSNGYPEISTSEALQRQLQQLFHLHDSGLDQAFIDALPVFLYGEVVGPNEPFDCAVCLCEFTHNDKLRLLPTCSHAFHITCIDTWLLSNSTCPLCRATLFAPGFPVENPIFEFDECQDEDDGCSRIGELGFPNQKRAEIEVDKKGVLPVRLGKFRKLDGGSSTHLDEASNSNLDARRCYSMGSYQYVLGKTNLRVALCPGQRRKSNKVVTSKEEHGGDSNSPVEGDLEGKKISNMSRGDSYSVSKIWLWRKKGDLPSSSSGDAGIDLPTINPEFSWTHRNSIV